MNGTKVFHLWRALDLRSHEQLPVLSGAAACPVFASTTSFQPSPVAFSLTPPSLLDGMKGKVASLNTSNAKTRLNFGSKPLPGWHEFLLNFSHL